MPSGWRPKWYLCCFDITGKITSPNVGSSEIVK